MTRTSSTAALSLAYPRPHAPRASRRAAPPARAPDRARAAVAVLTAAIGWLVLGCSGLVWAIAFTADQHSLALALAVWVLGFVAPSVLATIVAYRLDEDDAAPQGD